MILPRAHLPIRSSRSTSLPRERLCDPLRSEPAMPSVESKTIGEGAVTAPYSKTARRLDRQLAVIGHCHCASSILVAIQHDQLTISPFETNGLGTGLPPERESIDGCDRVSSSKEIKSGLEAKCSLMSATEVSIRTTPGTRLPPQANRHAILKAEIAWEHDWEHDWRSCLHALSLFPEALP